MTSKQSFSVGVVLLGMAVINVLSTTPARASFVPIVDITVNDGSPNSTYGTDPRAGISESGETEANTVSDPSWDLRAFAYNPTTNELTVVSGFNPLTTNEGFALGDIMIDINGYTNPSRPSGSDGYYTYANPGFEFAVDVTSASGGMLTYNVVGMDAGSTVESGYYAQNAISDPWALAPGSVVTPAALGLISAVTTMTDAQVLSNLNTDVGTNGGTNYVWTINLSSVAGSFLNGATFHLTEACGNDLLVGHLDAGVVPEPTTIGLITVAGVALVVFRRRTRQEQ